MAETDLGDGRSIQDPRTLIGEWAYVRQVDDRHAGRRLAAHGELVLGPASDGTIRWTERGTLSWDDHSVPVSRELVLEHRADGWVVLFADGKDFHPWRPGWSVRHHCAADVYDGCVSCTVPGAWTVTWEVRGPAKDYTMTTTFTRPEAPDH